MTHGPPRRALASPHSPCYSATVSVAKRIALVLTVLLLLLVGAVAWMLRSRAEPVPDVLPPIDAAQADPMSVVIPGTGGLPDLKLADYKGKTVYLVLGDRESMQAKESKEFDRALNRWTYPPDVVGFGVGDAEGFKLFAGKVEEMMGGIRPELRIPLYIDFEGTITKTFKLPKGHVGIVVLGPDGAVKLRHSGPPKKKEDIKTPEDDIVARLKAALGAEEPVLPPAPPFKVGDLDNAACAGKTCIFVFLTAPVKKTQLPGVEGGFEGDMEASMKQLQDPNVRLAGLVHDSDAKLVTNKEAAAKVQAVLVGGLEGVELKHWRPAAPTPESRTPFEIPADQAAVVIIDPTGKLAVRELGVVRMYKFGGISDLLGVDLSDRRE